MWIITAYVMTPLITGLIAATLIRRYESEKIRKSCDTVAGESPDEYTI